MWKLVKQTYNGWSDHDAQSLGAALAYYTVFSLAPLLVIAIAICGMVFGREAVQGQISGQLSGLVGAGAGGAIQDMLKHARSPAAGIVATIIGFIVLFFGASGVFNELRTALNRIWNVKNADSAGVWGTIKGEFKSFAMIVGIGFLLLVSLLISAAVAGISHFASGYFPAATFRLVSGLVSFVVIAALFAVIFRYVPKQRLPWRDLWIGSLVTAVLFTAGKYAIGIYLGKASVGSSYGAAGSLIALLVWIYYSAQLFLFGAEFTHVYARERGSLKDTGPEKAGPPEPLESPRLAVAHTPPTRRESEAEHVYHTAAHDMGPVKAIAYGVAWSALLAGLGWWRKPSRQRGRTHT